MRMGDRVASTPLVSHGSTIRPGGTQGALILLGVVGAVVAELSKSSQTLAFVMFGNGASCDSAPCSIIRSSPGKPSWWWWLGSPVAWDRGSWRSSSRPLAGYSSTGSISIPVAGSGFDSRTRSIRSRSLAWCSRCSFLIVAACKVPRSTRTEGQMVFLLYLPSGVDPKKLEAEMRTKLKKSEASRSTSTWCKQLIATQFF